MTESEPFSPAQRRALEPYFTNLDGPVFALRNLPEVVKGALFARYSRSPKSLRRLFLDEFLDQVAEAPADPETGVGHAERLYGRVFGEYGDDSVAQLGGAHLACEGASNLLTKILERGRLMAYLEQSTRYIAYTDKRGGCWKYLVPTELDDSELRQRYTRTLDLAFSTYARWLEPMQEHYRRRYPRATGDSQGVYRRTIRAKALDSLRGLLPAATQSNVGIFGSGQAYEALILRMLAHPLAEAREYAALMLAELRKVIPAFLERVDRPDRGGLWCAYLRETRAAAAAVAADVLAGVQPQDSDEVTLIEWDPDGEVKVVAAALYAVSRLPDAQLLSLTRRLSTEQRAAVLTAYVGERGNRRHRPGRAFERTTYRFDILGDYGAFRDLQRHRMLTIEWQPLGPEHGHVTPEAVAETGMEDDWKRVMDASAELYEHVYAAGLPTVAPYTVCMAYRVRYVMQMNAREAMHVIELRTAPQGHAAYRRVCQKMHRLIAEKAGHRAIAATMRFADHSAVELERLAAERAGERRRPARR